MAILVCNRKASRLAVAEKQQIYCFQSLFSFNSLLLNCIVGAISFRNCVGVAFNVLNSTKLNFLLAALERQQLPLQDLHWIACNRLISPFMAASPAYLCNPGRYAHKYPVP
jgi:hypothetical protein